jgi:hypothetical protein
MPGAMDRHHRLYRQPLAQLTVDQVALLRPLSIA